MLGSTPAVPSLTSSPPMLMAPRPDGCEVVWAVTGPSLGQIEIEQADGSVRLAGEDRYGFVPQGDTVLRVRLEDLAPGRVHRLRTVTTEAAGAPVPNAPAREAAYEPVQERSAWRELRTLDPSAATSSFVVWNDTHDAPETLALLDDRSPRADLLVWNGDVCNNWTDPAQLVPTILTPGGRDITAGRPLAFSFGNHDVRGPFAHRLPEVVATPHDRPYYAMRSGPVAAVVLSTGEDKPDHHPSFEGRAAFAASRARQARWLAATLRKPEFATAPYRLVFCHMPLRWVEEEVLTEDDYASGHWDEYSRASRELWDPALRAWGAQAVISGHTHVPALLEATQEFPYAQVIGGGHTPEDATWIEGEAGVERLRILVRRLDGTILYELALRPL